jgi:predicted transcriptional regulator
VSAEVSTTIRLDAETVALLDALIPHTKQHPALRYARASRALVIRAAIEKGLPAIAAEMGVDDLEVLRLDPSPCG